MNIFCHMIDGTSTYCFNLNGWIILIGIITFFIISWIISYNAEFK